MTSLIPGIGYDIRKRADRSSDSIATSINFMAGYSDTIEKNLTK
jgi:hypothetical protein